MQVRVDKIRVFCAQDSLLVLSNSGDLSISRTIPSGQIECVDCIASHLRKPVRHATRQMGVNQNLHWFTGYIHRDCASLAAQASTASRSSRSRST